jgi:hypothetical protein
MTQNSSSSSSVLRIFICALKNRIPPTKLILEEKNLRARTTFKVTNTGRRRRRRRHHG